MPTELPIDNDAPPQKVDGRTKAGRAARMRAQTQSAPRQTQVREPMRDPMREGVVAIGHGGERLSRKRKQTADIFQIPEGIIPPGWEYQWCAVSVVGNTEILLDQNLMFAENGWRPVPADRHDGRFMPVGHKGNVIRGGQMLMERPKALCEEARAEDEMLARRQVRDRDQSLMGGKANVRNMPTGFEMGGKYRGTGGDLKMSIDRGLDIPKPSHELAEPGE